MPDKADKGMIHGIMSISSKVDYTAFSDVQILKQSKRNPVIFEVLVDRYEAPFFRKAQSILRSKEDSEEVVQDAFTRIFLYSDKYEEQDGATFASWGYKILIRVALTRYGKLKKKRDSTLVLEPEHYESLPDNSNFVETLSVRNEVLEVLSKLPETAGRILRLQFLEGKTQDEIARREGVSVSALKTRIHRAKKLFKQNINNHDK